MGATHAQPLRGHINRHVCAYSCGDYLSFEIELNTTPQLGRGRYSSTPGHKAPINRLLIFTRARESELASVISQREVNSHHSPVSLFCVFTMHRRSVSTKNTPRYRHFPTEENWAYKNWTSRLCWESNNSPLPISSAVDLNMCMTCLSM
jgi:hypothetical protein